MTTNKLNRFEVVVVKNGETKVFRDNMNRLSESGYIPVGNLILSDNSVFVQTLQLRDEIYLNIEMPEDEIE